MLKKLLIISSYAPPAISGAPLMMYNLLQYFPEYSFAILTSHSGIDDRVSKDRWLKANYYFFDSKTLTASDQRLDNFVRKLKTSLKNNILTKFLGELFFLFYLPFSIVKKARKIISSEKIEILLAYSDSGPSLFSVYLLHKLTGKPYFLYFYDLYYRNKLPFLHRTLAKFLEPKLFKSASKIIVMSEAIAEYFHSTYGVNSEIIYNSIAIPTTRPVLSKTTTPFKLVYTGTIYWAQADAARNLIAAVESIDDPKVQLWLYTPHDKNYLKELGIYDSNKVFFASALPAQMPEIQRSASILVVLLGFKTKYPLLIKTSSPGKTYEYMISGRPILVHAPKDSFIAIYAEQNKSAMIVGEDNIEKLKEAILTLLTDQGLTSKLIENAWLLANKNHNEKVSAERFKRLFEI